MKRRDFIKAVGAPALASACMGVAARAEDDKPSASPAQNARPAEKTWLFWDWWHVEHQDNVELCQGTAEWQPEATYEDANFDYLGFWPCVWQDEAAGNWRMLYFATGIPLTLMGAESDDGIHWKPLDRPDVKVNGTKYSPNHLFTLPSANAGPMYIDPIAADGKRFKFCAVQRGGAAADRAKHDPNSYFHEIVTGEGVKSYLADNVIVTSTDGLHWQVEPDARWGGPPWHPDPPVNCYYNSQRNEHVMITRPGWGDRRIAVQTSPDALEWSNLELMMETRPARPAADAVLRHEGRPLCGRVRRPALGGPLPLFSPPAAFQPALGAHRLPVDLQPRRHEFSPRAAGTARAAERTRAAGQRRDLSDHRDRTRRPTADLLRR